jgi:ribosome maturation factor RimP
VSGLKEKMWDLVEPIVSRRGLEIFDIEMPRGQGCLRVFVSRPKNGGTQDNDAANQGVAIDDCSKIAKEILDLEGLDEFMPGSTILEVSSPGINRKLSRTEHFYGAVGERLRLVVDKDVILKAKDIIAEDSGASNIEKEVVRGTLVSFDGKILNIDEEKPGKDKISEAKPISLPLENIHEARVDFLFS